MSKVYLCAFGDMRLCLSAFRFYNQARAMEVFDRIFIYNETNLDLDFMCAMKDKIYIKSPTGSRQRGGGGNSWFWLLVLETANYLANLAADRRGRHFILH